MDHLVFCYIRLLTEMCVKVETNLLHADQSTSYSIKPIKSH